jgi:hypothetical protein
MNKHQQITVQIDGLNAAENQVEQTGDVPSENRLWYLLVQGRYILMLHDMAKSLHRRRDTVTLIARVSNNKI